MPLLITISRSNPDHLAICLDEIWKAQHMPLMFGTNTCQQDFFKKRLFHNFITLDISRLLVLSIRFTAINFCQINLTILIERVATHQRPGLLCQYHYRSAETERARGRYDTLFYALKTSREIKPSTMVDLIDMKYDLPMIGASLHLPLCYSILLAYTFVDDCEAVDLMRWCCKCHTNACYRGN